MTYKINKTKEKKQVKINKSKIKGFKIKPNNNVKYEGVTVNKLLIINPSFVQKVLKRKTKRKLEMYLEFIIDILENDDDSNNSGKIEVALNDLTRYKSIVKNNYRVYLDELYYKLLMKKIDVIEKELKVKKMYLDMSYQEEYLEEKKTGKSR